jgi:hypothetical protein
MYIFKCIFKIVIYEYNYKNIIITEISFKFWRTIGLDPKSIACEVNNASLRVEVKTFIYILSG